MITLKKTSKLIKIDSKVYRSLASRYTPNSVEFKQAILNKIEQGTLTVHDDNGTLKVETTNSG